MVDCRPAAGAPGVPPHDLAHAAPNGGAPPENHHNQSGASGDMGGHGLTPPAARAATPAASTALSTYTPGNMQLVGGGCGFPPGSAGGAAPYVCGVKSVVWMSPSSPPPHAPPPPPPTVNPHVYKSVQANGADLPMNDIPTLRYYFNLGVECMWAAYGPPPPHHPPRHYEPRDISQEMQQMSLQDRGGNPGHGGEHNKHKPPENKPAVTNNKGNGQRPLLGPRFKRGNNQDGNQNSNHNQNKGHNNNMGNKGPNNRRNSHGDSRGPSGYGVNSTVGGGAGGAGGDPEPACVLEPPLLTLPYIPYPPPLYPIPYYPVDADPGMMGMMGGMGYVGYEEGVEYTGVPYYPPAAPPQYPPPPPHPHPHPAHHQHLHHQLPHHHQEHK